jgi:hypothetical protein
MSWGVILGSVLAAACVVVVAIPFLHESLRDGERLNELDEVARGRLAAAEERDQALAELKELEFDHRTGKVTDDDYRALVQPLRRRAASALANGATLPARTQEPAAQQPFSESSARSSRQDR